MTPQFSDNDFMRRALELAKKGEGSTLPNPMVGAVIVKGGRIIGEGFHTKYGEAHAEIEALRNTSEEVAGATIYVNLEPCSHQGKTGPCTKEIIKSGVKRVVIGVLDPNAKVSGDGAKVLEKAGIEVTTGILEKESRTLNEIFFGFHKKRRPFIALKFASSLDGKIATRTGDSRGITGIKAIEYSYNLRRKYQSILIGSNTAVQDNPNLGTHSGHRDPLRIIIDSSLRVNIDSQIFRDKNVLVVVDKQTDKKKIEILNKKGVDVLVVENKQTLFKELFRHLMVRGIISILVEGGGTILGSFIEENLFDKLYVFYAPIIIGGEAAITPVEGNGVDFISDSHKVEVESFKRLGDDFLITAYPKHYEV